MAGKPPPDDLVLDKWLDVNNPADIYVIGFQEVVPLSAANVLGAEDSGPIAKWESLIRQTLGGMDVNDERAKCETAPPSPFSELSTDQTSLDDLDVDHAQGEREDADHTQFQLIRSSTCNDGELEGRKQELKRVKSSQLYKNFGHLSWSIERSESRRADRGQLAKVAPACPRTRSLGSLLRMDHLQPLEKHRAQYVRLASKQMVGIHVSVWITRKLKPHIRRVRVSCVGIGLMGYLGNKGSVSVSLLLHQTSLCFVCTHLSHGEKEGDELRRNTDVMEILRQTRFPTCSKAGPQTDLPKTIMAHECVILFGDLNYRLNLSDGETRALVEKRDWQALLESDQLKKELLEGKVLDGWHEGPIHFAPTYKYEMESDQYTKNGEKPRTPAWCDRILWFGKGLKILSYTQTACRFSDHRPVKAVVLAEVEVLNENKLM